MNLLRAATPESFASLVHDLTMALGADDLYVISHDLSTLQPLRNDRVAITDETTVDALLGGSTTPSHRGVLTPIHSRSFPLLVASSGEQPLSSPATELAGQLFDLHREFFDEIEFRRRTTPFSPAAQLQWSMLPIRSVTHGEFDAAGVLVPAASVAGDAYDIALTPGGDLSVFSMDAMGHGVSATLSTALALAALRTARKAGASLVEQVRSADDAVLQEYDGSRFVTMAAVEMSADSIRVINAGHEPLRVSRPGTDVRTLELKADPPLGLDGHTDYFQHELPGLEAGTSLVLLSDGAGTARDPDGDEFGVLGIETAIHELAGQTSLQTADRIGRAVSRFVATDLADDLTVVVVNRRLR